MVTDNFDYLLMKKLLLLSALLMAFAAATEAKKQRKLTEKDMGAYLFTYFNDPTHSLFMAISYDGYTFTAINGSEPIIAGDSIADQRGIRDPHIYRAPNDKFYIAMTDLHVFGKQKGLRTTQWERPDKYGWGNNRGLVLMHNPLFEGGCRAQSPRITKLNTIKNRTEVFDFQKILLTT